MIRKIVCRSCGIDFEAMEAHSGAKVFCPNCASEADFQGGAQIADVGGYSLLELLGQGGMGQVYRARDAAGNDYALKVMMQETQETPEYEERFEREMRIMESLHHPNIVSLHARGDLGSFKYFVMELVEGQNLRKWMRESPLSEKNIADLVLQILEGLGYAHAQGIVHRDIKPENILLDKRSMVKLTDFGLARKLIASAEGASLTATNAFMGTANYMSPEQKINPKAVTHKSDLFSFGVVLYEMLTGGMLPMGVFQPPTYYRPVNSFWDDLTYRLLDLNPDVRPNNAEEVHTAILHFLSNPAGAVGQEVVTRTTAAAMIDVHPTDELVKREDARARDKLQILVREAEARYREGRFQVAMEFFDSALMLTNDSEERENLMSWKRLCQDRLRSPTAKPNQKPFLCPLCLKAFSLDEQEEIPAYLNCPFCHQELHYDRNRKQLNSPQAIKKTTRVAEEEPAGEWEWTPALRRQVIFLVLFVLAWSLDWLFPEYFDNMVTLLCQNGLSRWTGWGAGSLILLLRFLIHAMVLVWFCWSLYVFYGFSRPRHHPEDSDLTVIRSREHEK